MSNPVQRDLVGPGESQRDSASKPRVARHELPWVRRGARFPTPTGLCPCSSRPEATTPLGLPNLSAPLPRVARASQPWAGGHNPFGIGVGLLCLLFYFVALNLVTAADLWPAALERMPLGTNVSELNETNCVALILKAFRSNDVVKALIFMPGATDEFYMFHRARATLTNSSPTLLDAIRALTNQTLIRVTFLPPLLLLHTDEDPLEPLIAIGYQPLADKLKQMRFVPHALYNDRDWDFLQPILTKTLKADIQPGAHTYESYHFYRHSFAAWNLTGWEALEAVAMAGKSRATVRRKPPLTYPRNEVVFEVDRRVRATPKLDQIPR